MAPAGRSGSGPRQLELDLSIYEALLDTGLDEVTLGRLQDALEILVSERSHPMAVALGKRKGQLEQANNVIEHELQLRKTRKLSSKQDAEGAAELEEDVHMPDIGNNEKSESSSGDEDKDSHSEEDSTEEPTAIDKEKDAYSDKEHNPGDTPDVGDDEGDQDQFITASESGDDEAHPSIPADDTQLPAGNVNKESNTANKGNGPSAKSGDDSISDFVSPTTGVTEDSESERKCTGGKTTLPLDGKPVKSQDHERNEPGPGNDKFVANPKSEYVSTQTMPIHTFYVFKDGDEKTEDEEAYKRRLGVVSYPKEDLSTLTAGPVPMEDYTRSKPSNQVQFNTYATFLEPYFRQFTDEDLQFLQQPSVGVGVEAINLKSGKKMSPFVFPPLGPHYRQNWAQQEAELAGTEITLATQKSNEAHVNQLVHEYDAAGGINQINDQHLDIQQGLSLGPFTERLIAAIISEAHEGGNAEINTDTSDVNCSETMARIPTTTAESPLIADFEQLEERVKSEFSYVGVLDTGLLRNFEKHKSEFRLAAPRARNGYMDPTQVEVDWVNGSEDDEISRELRYLQSRLSDVTQRNSLYKSRLIPVLQEQLSWQEYTSIVQDLDKQVDQLYQKRTKPASTKIKKRKGVDSPLESNSATPSSTFTPETSRVIEQKPTIKSLIDKRERWISKIGPLFRPAHEMMREYEKPKFLEVKDEAEPELEGEKKHEGNRLTA